jgi:predicted enzyme related to lactoylglutathione lyase
MASDCCYFEIMTADPERSQAMLGALFGWEFQPSGDAYWMFACPNGIGGGLQKVDAVEAGNATSIYMHVASVEATLEKAQTLGGEVVKGRTEIGGGHGAYGLLRDPGGAVLGIWEPEAS